MSFHIHIDTDSFFDGGAGKVGGKVWIEIDGYRFSEEGWSDFVYPILFWWVPELHQLKTGRLQKATLMFMDGPFLVQLQRQGDRVEVQFLKDAIGGRVVKHTATVEPSGALNALNEAIEMVELVVEQSGLELGDGHRELVYVTGLLRAGK